MAGVRRSRWIDELRQRSRRRLSPCGNLRRTDSQGRKACRSSRRAGDESRVRAQSQDCALARFDDPAPAAWPRRRGDRMMGWMAPLRHLSAKLLSDRNSSEWEPSMGEVTTIGLDLAKHVFQVHGVD